MKSIFVCLLFCAAANGAAVSPLLSRGYAAIPEPQKVTLGASDIPFGSGWRLETASGVAANDISVQSLRDDLADRFGIKLGGNAGVIRLAIAPVEIGAAQDRDREVLAAQAYRMEIKRGAVTITGGAPAGLFYGVETLVQLVKRREGSLWLPESQITDWPDLQLRQIYWDDAHHLDKLSELKHAVRQAAFFKINGFAIKLEGHFQYRSAPAIVEPYALTPAEFQELTDYGLRYHVQVIPYLDGPAHIAFILKHPEYAKLRSFADSNYELCATNPDSYKLLFGMFQDLIDANKGGKYFYLSTDEPYYIGKADNAQCKETDAGGPSKLLVEFINKTSKYLHDRGRTVIFWGEYPMKVEDIPQLAPYLVNGETYGPAFDKALHARGIRSMIYTSSEGEEKLFPDYFVLPASLRLHPARAQERVAGTFDKISTDPARQYADLMGEINAGWADMGLHAETFWLGYAASGGTGWHPGSPTPREQMTAFYPLFYGQDVVNMDRVYELLSRQAQFWSDSWETVESKSRKPIFGNSNSIYNPRRPAHDQALPLPPENPRRAQLAAAFLTENDELMGLLGMNIQRASFNRYNLEVLTAIAEICRHNLEMLLDIARMQQLRTQAAKAQPRQALAMYDQALNLAEKIRRDRNRVLRDATETWYKTWHPRVAEANGRKFLHEVDDVKDHLPDRTVDMSYLVLRELQLPFGEWVDGIRAERNEVAKKSGAAERGDRLDWGRLE